MAEITNLRRARKARGEREKKAADNRLRHGTPKHLREAARRTAEKEAHELAAHKLDQPRDSRK